LLIINNIILGSSRFRRGDLEYQDDAITMIDSGRVFIYYNWIS
jgi:hypothetical protein